MNSNVQENFSSLRTTNKKRFRQLQNAHPSAFLSGKFSSHGKTVWLEPGDTLIDRFIIKECLGQGSLGTVYLAQDNIRGHEVALKTVELGPLSEEMSLRALQREMSFYAQINDYRYVIRVFDLHFVPWGGTSLLVMSMEYANNGTFRKWLIDHENDVNSRITEGMEYIKMACAGVGAIHDAHVAHLDLKPENLLFVGNVAKVSDFGASRCTQRLIQASILRLQETSSEKGTPAYMSPEHFLAPHTEDVGPSADIYSLGVMLYELCHPKCWPPFSGSYERLRELHLNVSAPKISGIDDNLSDIIATCLKKNPEDRYQSAWDLFEDLENGCCSIKNSDEPQDDTEKDNPEDIEELWQTASQSFSQGIFNEAIQLTEKILSKNPNHVPAQVLREELCLRFDQAERFYQTIAKQLPNGDLHELVTLLVEAVNLFPDHPSSHLIQSQLSVKAEEYRNMMEQGLRALQTNNWELTLELLQQASRLQVNMPQLKPIIGALTRLKDLRAQIDHAVDTLNLEKAIMLACIFDHEMEEMKQNIRALNSRR
jgi:serine/threonine protein kinase